MAPGPTRASKVSQATQWIERVLENSLALVVQTIASVRSLGGEDMEEDVRHDLPQVGGDNRYKESQESDEERAMSGSQGKS